MAKRFGIPSVTEVREYLKDYPFKNFKYEDEFFSDAEIISASNWAEQRFYALPPIDNVAVTDIPIYIMLIGVVAQLFKSAYINATINYNPGISENGINVPTGEDANMFFNLHGFFDKEFSVVATQFKQSMNIKASLSSIRSPYNRDRKNGAVWPYGNTIT